MKRLFFFLLLAVFTVAGLAWQSQGGDSLTGAEAQELMAESSSDPNVVFGGSDIQPVRPLQDIEFLNTLVVIVFGLIIFILAIFRIKPDQVSSEDFFRLIILSLVIIATMFLIAAGWDNQQTAPAFGILGTIAGYLLGRQSK